MKEITFLFTVLVAVIGFNAEVNSQESSATDSFTNEKSVVTRIESFDYSSLEPLLNRDDDKTYVINFWATWCKPCVEELPSFEKLNKVYESKNVEVILVSLDFPKHIENRVIPFINKHHLQSKVILMNDPDQNTWIPKISDKWSGSIPATLIYNKHARAFYEQSFTYDMLQKELNKILKAKQL